MSDVPELNPVNSLSEHARSTLAMNGCDAPGRHDQVADNLYGDRACPQHLTDASAAASPGQLPCPLNSGSPDGSLEESSYSPAASNAAADRAFDVYDLSMFGGSAAAAIRPEPAGTGGTSNVLDQTGMHTNGVTLSAEECDVIALDEVLDSLCAATLPPARESARTFATEKKLSALLLKEAHARADAKKMGLRTAVDKELETAADGLSVKERRMLRARRHAAVNRRAGDAYTFILEETVQNLVRENIMLLQFSGATRSETMERILGNMLSQNAMKKC